VPFLFKGADSTKPQQQAPATTDPQTAQQQPNQ